MLAGQMANTCMMLLDETDNGVTNDNDQMYIQLVK